MDLSQAILYLFMAFKYIDTNYLFLLLAAAKGPGNLLRTSLPPTAQYHLSLQYPSRACHRAVQEKRLYVCQCIPWRCERESVRHDQHVPPNYLTLNCKADEVPACLDNISLTEGNQLSATIKPHESRLIAHRFLLNFIMHNFLLASLCSCSVLVT